MPWSNKILIPCETTCRFSNILVNYSSPINTIPPRHTSTCHLPKSFSAVHLFDLDGQNTEQRSTAAIWNCSGGSIFLIHESLPPKFSSLAVTAWNKWMNMKRNALSQCVLQTEDEGRRRKLIGSRRRLAKFNEVKSKKARRLRSTKQSPASRFRFCMYIYFIIASVLNASDLSLLWLKPWGLVSVEFHIWSTVWIGFFSFLLATCWIADVFSL